MNGGAGAIHDTNDTNTLVVRPMSNIIVAWNSYNNTIDSKESIMHLTTRKYYLGYLVNNVDMRVLIERSDIDTKVWNLVIDDLGIVTKLNSKKQALEYVESLIDDGQINLV